MSYYIVARQEKNGKTFYWSHSLRSQKKMAIEAFMKNYSDTSTWEECRDKYGWKCIKVNITPA